MSHCHGTARGKGGLLSRERRPPFDPPRERQGRFDLAPAPLTTKREGPCPSFLDYPPYGTSGKHCAYFGGFCFDGACRGGIAALAAFLIGKTTALAVIFVLFISSFQKIVDADAIKISERAQNVRRQHSFATLVICVCALRNIDCFADLTLCQIGVFPQIADAPVSFHVYHQIQYM